MRKRPERRYDTKKRRQNETDEREERWTKAGLEVDANASPADASRAKVLRHESNVLAASEHWGVNLTGIPIPARNEVANTLLLMQVVTGNDLFGEAHNAMVSLGLGGPDYKTKLNTMLPPDNATIGIVGYVEKMIAVTGSERDAAEQAAEKFKVPGSNYDAARQAVTARVRTTRKARR